MQEERAMRISTKNNAITMAISTKKNQRVLVLRKMGPKKEFSMDSLELRADVGAAKKFSLDLFKIKDQHQRSFLGTRPCSPCSLLAILSRFRPFKPASMFVYFYVTHHCFLPFISIHFFAESDFIFPFWQTLMPVIFP